MAQDGIDEDNVKVTDRVESYSERDVVCVCVYVCKRERERVASLSHFSITKNDLSLRLGFHKELQP